MTLVTYSDSSSSDNEAHSSKDIAQSVSHAQSQSKLPEAPGPSNSKPQQETPPRGEGRRHVVTSAPGPLEDPSPLPRFQESPTNAQVLRSFRSHAEPALSPTQQSISSREPRANAPQSSTPRLHQDLEQQVEQQSLLKRSPLPNPPPFDVKAASDQLDALSYIDRCTTPIQAPAGASTSKSLSQSQSPPQAHTRRQSNVQLLPQSIQPPPTPHELIRMLQEYVLATHDDLIFSDTTGKPLSVFGLPEESSCTSPSDSVLPDLDLETHLNALRLEIDADYERKSRINSAFDRDPRLLAQVMKGLDKKLLDVKFDQTQTLKFRTPAEKMAQFLLRQRQSSKPLSPPPEPAFEVSAVTLLNEDGTPADKKTYYLEQSLSWPGFLDALGSLTMSWQAAEAGYAHGYRPEHGKWKYLISSEEPEPFPMGFEYDYLRMKDMYNAYDYERMKTMLLREAGKVKVLFLHQVQIDCSKELKIEYDELRDRESKIEGNEPLDANGNPLFERYFNFRKHCDRRRRLAEQKVLGIS